MEELLDTLYQQHQDTRIQIALTFTEMVEDSNELDDNTKDIIIQLYNNSYTYFNDETLVFMNKALTNYPCWLIHPLREWLVKWS